MNVCVLIRVEPTQFRVPHTDLAKTLNEYVVYHCKKDRDKKSAVKTDCLQTERTVQRK